MHVQGRWLKGWSGPWLETLQRLQLEGIGYHELFLYCFESIAGLHSLCMLSIVGTGLAIPGSSPNSCSTKVQTVAQKMATLHLEKVHLTQGEAFSGALAGELASTSCLVHMVVAQPTRSCA